MRNLILATVVALSACGTSWPVAPTHRAGTEAQVNAAGSFLFQGVVGPGSPACYSNGWRGPVPCETHYMAVTRGVVRLSLEYANDTTTAPVPHLVLEPYLNDQILSYTVDPPESAGSPPATSRTLTVQVPLGGFLEVRVLYRPGATATQSYRIAATQE